MLNLCFYFEVHQPWRLRTYRYADVGRRHDYFDLAANRAIFERVAAKCYLPMNRLLLKAINACWPHFRVSFSITTTVLEQMRAFAPEVLASFQALLATGCVELVSETSHHSLAGLYSPREFADEVRLHQEAARRHLGITSRVFRNTELISNDQVARQVAAMGYQGLLIEGADRLFAQRPVTRPSTLAATPGLAAMARHYRLSDDIAFRFSNRAWQAWPLTVPTYVDWLHAQANAADAAHQGAFLGLFMDYETFGEHQWADTGIFDFMAALPAAVLADPLLGFATPSEVLAHTPRADTPLALPDTVSWADLERDTSAWTGNRIQRAALDAAYQLEPAVRASGNAALLRDWRRLLTSDHFYYMSTKYWSDGDVHKYFSPYESPYDAYINYMNVLADVELRAAPAARSMNVKVAA